MKRTLLGDDAGTAMTEAVIVIPFILVIWMGLILAHHTYRAHLEAQVNAHSLALEAATTGRCSGGANEDEHREDELSHILTDSPSRELIVEAAGGDNLFAWSHFAVNASVTATELPAIFGSSTRRMKAKAKLLCNTEPAGGLGDMFYDFVEDFL